MNNYFIAAARLVLGTCTAAALMASNSRRRSGSRPVLPMTRKKNRVPHAIRSSVRRADHTGAFTGD